MTSVIGNGWATNASGGANFFSWWEFDDLPPLLRRLIQYAPLQLGTERAAINVANGGPEAAAREELRVVRSKLRALTLRDYGPQHPDLLFHE